jgi:hypothetical protein
MKPPAIAGGFFILRISKDGDFKTKEHVKSRYSQGMAQSDAGAFR